MYNVLAYFYADYFDAGTPAPLNTRLAPNEYAAMEIGLPVDVVDTTTCMAKASNNSKINVFIMNSAVANGVKMVQRETLYALKCKPRSTP